MIAIRKKILKLIAKHTPSCGVRIMLLRMCGYEIGRRVYIGEDVIIIDILEEAKAGLTIGDRVAVSPRVTFVLHSQPNDSRITPYINSKKGPILIRNDAWLGTGAVILPNVEIGEGAVVGANSVVTKNVAAFTVVGGVPAGFIKPVNVSRGDRLHSAKES